jgi:hypothetical protein
MIYKELEGSGLCAILKVLSRHMSGETEEGYEKRVIIAGFQAEI